MKNRIIFFSFLGLVFSACVSSKQSVKDPSQYKIIPFQGVDNVILGVSTVKDVKKQIGKAKVRTVFRSNDFPILLGEFIKEIKYPELGLTFEISASRGKFSKKTLESIIIDSTSKVKAVNGFGIGTSYQEVANEFGFENLGSSKSNERRLIYYLTNNYGIYIGLYIDVSRISDTSTFKVEQFRITRH